KEYCRTGMVHNMQRQGVRLYGTVDVPHLSPTIAASPTNEAESLKPTALSQHRYTVEVEIESSTSCKSTCLCSPNTLTLCPHAAALLYQWLARPAAFAILAKVERDDLAEVSNMVEPVQFTRFVPSTASL